MGTYFKKLDIEKCSENSINWDGDESNQDQYLFFKPSDESLNDIKSFGSAFMCLKNDDAQLMGDYNSQIGKQLVLTFSVCRNKPGCRPESQIMNWLNRKFIITLENTI